MKKKSTIHVDGRPMQADADTNVLQAVLQEGLNLPYFCWHPALGSVGACRQCAVQQFRDENDTVGRVVMACMTPCAENTRVSLKHPEAEGMRKAVVEFLMTNHPHDCPVCEEGGHCHLQDMTVMTGHNYRRYRFTKRTHRNQDLGSFVNHEMNRCIACYRCVRYYKDYAGGKDLDVFGTGADVYFGRAQDGTLESEFAGNLVEVCPTGVFTDKPYGEEYTRKWDLQTAPSICTHCSIGCNITPGERYGRLKRVENRYHGELNGYFICDRGRYGYGYVNREDRPRQVLRRIGDELAVESAADAVGRLAGLVKLGHVIGIGSPRASLEANYALRTLVGPENFYQGVQQADADLAALGVEILRTTPARVATVREAEQADAVLVLGEDLLNTGARLALAVRQAVRSAGFALATKSHIPAWQDASVRTLAQDVRSPLFVATPAATGLDDVATVSHRGGAAEIARLGMAVAHALDGARHPVVPGLGAEAMATAARIAQALLKAERPLIVSGAGCRSLEVLHAARNLVGALAAAGRKPSLSLVFAECNSVGTALMGGATLDQALARMQSGAVETALVIENDLTRRAPAAALETAFAKTRRLVLMDCLTTPTQAWADTVIPVGSATESDGTLVNFEGRAQRFFQVFPPADAIRESWRWLQQAARASGRDELGDNLDALTQGCARTFPELAAIVDAAPGARFRIAGAKIPRQPHRYSGRTAMDAEFDVHEPRPPADPDSPLAFTMEGARSNLSAAVIPMFWAPSWNSPQAVNRFQQEIGGPLRGGDPGVRLFPAAAAGEPHYHAVPAPAAGLRIVALHHLFGSEELAAQAPIMQDRNAAPYVALHPETAREFGLREGVKAIIRCGSDSCELPVRTREDLARNCVGMPLGVPGMRWFAANAEAQLSRGNA